MPHTSQNHPPVQRNTSSSIKSEIVKLSLGRPWLGLLQLSVLSHALEGQARLTHVVVATGSKAQLLRASTNACL